MYIKEINKDVFDEYAKTHILKNFFQTKEYGDLMSNSDFNVMYIALFDNENIVGASLILYKEIMSKIKYGYAPRGFLINYYNKELVSEFTKRVKSFFLTKGFAFIKINPEITYALVNPENKTKQINKNTKELISYLKSIGYNKLKDTLYFESVLPKFTPIIHLPTYDMESLNNSINSNIDLINKKGLRLVKGNENDIETFYKFVEHKKNKTLVYYKYFYESFNKSDMVDLLLLEVDYNLYIKYLQKEYAYEQDINDKINDKFKSSPNEIEYYNEKMESDKKLNDIAQTLKIATLRMEENITKEYVGGAFVVKDNGRITIIITGQDETYKELDVKTYLFYKMIDEYKKAGYTYLDMYGITGNFSDTNPYKKLNDFKLKFNPQVYEYIGEFDLIISKTLHQLLWSTNKIQKEFYKPSIKS